MRLASAQRARSGYREGIDDMATHPARAHGRTSKPPLRGRILTLCSLLWLVAPAAAEMAPQGVRGHCEIRFIGSSTLHDFSGEVRSQPFELETHVDDSDGHPWWSGSVEVAVAEMDTGIARRDRKMRTIFDAKRFPWIVAEFANVGSTTLAQARSGGEPELDFDLTIRETKRPVAAKLSHWAEEGAGASFDVEFELSLESFGLEVPPVLGLISVGDAVQVRAHVILDALAGAQPETTLLDGPLESSASGS